MVDEKSKPVVYVSYSSKEEERSPLIASIQDSLQDVDFQIDVERVEYGDNFKEFIQKIGNARYLIVILSDSYLKQFYCMYELLAVYKNGDLAGSMSLKDRVFFVRENGFKLDNANRQREVSDYWAAVHTHRVEGIKGDENYTPTGSKEHVAEIKDKLNELFEWLQHIHSPNHDKLLSYELVNDNAFHPIRNWLARVKPLPGRKNVSEKDHLEYLQKQIAYKLSNYTKLVERLASELGCENNGQDVANELLSCSDYGELLNRKIRVVCSESLKELTPENRTLMLNDLRSIMTWLLGMAVIRTNLINNEGKRVPVVRSQTKAGRIAEIGAISNVPTSVVQVKNKSLYSKDALAPYREGSWNDDSMVNAQAFTTFVYASVMGVNAEGNSYKSGATLPNVERARLNARIIAQADRLAANYHSVVEENDKGKFFTGAGFQNAIKTLLPAFHFYQQGKSDTLLPLFSPDEVSFEEAFTDFFQTVLGDP